VLVLVLVRVVVSRARRRQSLVIVDGGNFEVLARDAAFRA
jgi:hypothetical protein